MLEIEGPDALVKKNPVPPTKLAPAVCVRLIPVAEADAGLLKSSITLLTSSAEPLAGHRTRAKAANTNTLNIELFLFDYLSKIEVRGGRPSKQGSGLILPTIETYSN